MPLQVVPAAFGIKKSGAKNLFTPLALERMFEPPSPPPDSNNFASPSQPECEPRVQTPPSPQPHAGSLFNNSASTNIPPIIPDIRTPTSPTSIVPSNTLSLGNTTPSPNVSPAQTKRSTPSPSITSSSSQSIIPSPSAGRGPLGTFRLPHRHAPLRPSRLSESHLIKPYASFEADDSSHSSIPKDVLADMSNVRQEKLADKDSATPSGLTAAIDDDEERLTNDLDFGDDELVVGDDGDGDEDENDSILDPTSTDINEQLEQERQQARDAQQPEISQSSTAKRDPARPDEIVDTDIPGLTLFDGRKLSASYQFTFAAPRADETGDLGDRKSKEDRKREREAERQHRNIARTLLHPHNALRPITPEGGVESSPSCVSSHSDDPPIRDGDRTPSPGMLARQDPRLKLFQFQYDTFTRDHLSALVDSIAVGSVGSSPSLQVSCAFA